MECKNVVFVRTVSNRPKLDCSNVSFVAARMDGKSYFTQSFGENQPLIDLVVELKKFLSEDFWEPHNFQDMELVD